MMQNSDKRRSAYTVSKLTAEIKSILEERYPFVWLSGEISNIAKPSSGHVYFTLKDNKSQISAVIFRNQHRNVKFELQNGQEINGFGRISLYEPRGTYQFIFEFIEPRGAGALQLAFEQLKEKLSAEGLFDEKHKQKIPFLPCRIGVITSPSGAVIHDIRTVIDRRYPNTIIEIAPVSVQGENAIHEIVSALRLLNERNLSDVIIIARGGGSLEDLAAFNSEEVARAVFASKLPVVSAVGHETDYTICDFVSDLRAPTPSAAAELTVPDKQALKQIVSGLQASLSGAVHYVITSKRIELEKLSSRLISPKRKIDDLQFRIDDYSHQLQKAIQNIIRSKKESLNWKTEKLKLCSPLKNCTFLRNNLNHSYDRLSAAMSASVNEQKLKLKELTSRLNTLNPTAVIERGYSITRTIPDGTIVTDSGTVNTGQNLEVILSKGSLVCSVKGAK